MAIKCTVTENKSEPFQTQFGEKCLLNVVTFEGVEEKLWYEPGKMPHSRAKVGDIAYIEYGSFNGKKSRKLVDIEPGDGTAPPSANGKRGGAFTPPCVTYTFDDVQNRTEMFGEIVGGLITHLPEGIPFSPDNYASMATSIFISMTADRSKSFKYQEEEKTEVVEGDIPF